MTFRIYRLTEDFGQGQLKRWVLSSQNAALVFAPAESLGDFPGALCGRVQNPHITNTHRKIVLYTLLNFREAILGREELDANKWRLGEDLFVRHPESDANIWNTKAGGRD